MNSKPAFRLLLLLLIGFFAQVNGGEVRNLFLITTDGLRWQEVFSGAEKALISKQGGVRNTNEILERFWRGSPEERRKALLPFFWNVISKEGQIWGNQDNGSIGRVVNGLNFSYPGYNEMLTGSADPAIDSNDKRNNPNITVLEWVNTQQGFRKKVAAFCTWDVFPFIINSERSRIPIQSNWNPPITASRSREALLLADLFQNTTPIWEIMSLDSLMFYSTLEYLKHEKPRLIFLSFGETDEWAHEGRYDQYLRSAFAFDRYLQKLWEFVQSNRAYRNNTAFLITTDHGRGTGMHHWKNHGKDTEGSEFIWLAAIGPSIPAKGERRDTEEFTQSQVASTLAVLLGLDYKTAFPKAAPAMKDLFTPN